MEYAFTLFDGDVTNNGREEPATINRFDDVAIGQYLKITVTADGVPHEYTAKIMEEPSEELPTADLLLDDPRILGFSLYNVSDRAYGGFFTADTVYILVDYAEIDSTIHLKADIYDSTSISYDTPGEYELIYSATDSCGNTATESRMVTVESGSEYPYTLCTMGAYQGSDISGGDTLTISNVTWVTEPPADGKIRTLTVYGENCEIDGNAVENPISEGRAYDNGDISFSLPGGIWLSDPVHYGENPLHFQNEGSYISSLSWDSIRVEVTGEEEGA